MLLVVVRPEAEADLVEARSWYTRQRAGLADQFVDAVEEVLEQVRENPESHAQSLKNVRRAKVRRFPYVVTTVYSTAASKCLRSCMPVAILAHGSSALEVPLLSTLIEH